ncbi:MarR family winged helix-turn-helix transcriptional regulator [Brevibacillus dissolubilis]|uniref:MarR family winged helix-turn-helix transcriptional regulator n=1 Tax=Brevibacillus dissolubilis TaxID=1844116 RepID=UPI0011168474|nr:MarR family transcriptional regulator [Brevibacillus dissolubilis]
MPDLMHIRDQLRKINKTFGTMMAQEMMKFGFTGSQLIILHEIMNGPKTIGQISKSVDLSYSTVSGLIDRLERQEYVRRVRDEDDRRVIWIEQTEKLDELKEQIPLLTEHFYQQLFSDVSPAELDQLSKSLEMLLTQMERQAQLRETTL